MNISSNVSREIVAGTERSISSLDAFLADASLLDPRLATQSIGENALTFVQGVNFNGGAIAFSDDESWLSQTAAFNRGLSLSAYTSVESEDILPKSVDVSVAAMLNTGIQADSGAGDKDLTLTQTLDAGDYIVELFMMSPTDQARIFDIEIEGVTQEKVSLQPGNGDRQNPWSVYTYDVAVDDGALDIRLDKIRKSPLISGLRIWSIGESESEPNNVGGDNPNRSDTERSTLSRPPVFDEVSRQQVSVPSRPVFGSPQVQGINFSGGAISGDDPWVSQSDALKNGLSLSATTNIQVDINADNRLSRDVQNIFSTGIQASSQAGSKDIEIGQTLENGEYRVELFIPSPTNRERIFEVEIEGESRGDVTLADNTEGDWAIYSYTASITDGELNVVLDKTRKSPVISGLRVSPLEADDTEGDTVTQAQPVSEPSRSKRDSSVDSSARTPAQLVEEGGTTAPPRDEPTPPGQEQEAQQEQNETDPPASENPKNKRNKNSADSENADSESTDPVVDESTPPPSTAPRPLSPGSDNPTKGKLVWAEEFGPNWETQWSGLRNTSASENRRVIKDPTGQFDDILRVSYPKGGVGPSDGTQFKVYLDQPLESATLEYYVRFKPGFNPVRGGKLPGLVGGLPERRRENTGGNTPDGTDGWSARLGFRPARDDSSKVIVRGYTYLPKGQQDPKQNDEYVVDFWGNQFRTARQWNFGTTTPFLDPDTLNSELIIETGEWYKVSLQVQLNTPGEKDGFIKGFIQEPGSNKSRIAMYVPNLLFRNKGSELPIDRMFFSTFFGGSAPSYQAQRDESIDFRGFKIYDTPK